MKPRETFDRALSGLKDDLLMLGSMTEKAMTDFGRDATSYLGGAMLGVSTSVWGVAGFSLILGDYDKILEAAKAFVLGLGEMYTQKVSVEGVGEVSADLGKKPQASYTGKYLKTMLKRRARVKSAS